MTETAPKVIVIPAKKETPQEQAQKRHLRVAAYCRVSTNSKEQLTSYENQLAYYTEKIMKNPSWTMVKVFADEGKTGTSTCKRKEFLQMIRMCRQGKIDMILAKSRFPVRKEYGGHPQLYPRTAGTGYRSSLRNRISTPSIRRASSSSPYTAPSPSLKVRTPAPMSAGGSEGP